MVRTQNLYIESSLANFKIWVRFIYDSFVAAGWVQADDTGQLNGAGIDALVSVPTTAGAAPYFIFRMNDALQATAPCFVKVKPYAASAGAGGLELTTGTGTNLSGGMVGNYLTQACAQSNSGGTSTLYECLAAGDTSRITVVLGRTYYNSGTWPYFHIERSKDANGNDNGDYVLAAVGTSTNHYWWLITPAALGANALGAVPPTNTHPTTQFAPATTLWRGQVGYFPVTPVLVYPRNPLTGVLTGKRNDYTDGEQVSLTMYGQSRNYIVLFGQGSYWGYSTGVSCVMFRWE